ncbi:MAG: MetS family NSS transporter small subunit [Candidatus Cyclobacteriaceae bacterium M2_1C_046]
MSSSAIIAMIVINLIVMGGFIFFLRIAINKEKKKAADEE